MGMRDLPDEAGLPDARLTHDRHDLTTAGAGGPEHQAQLFQLGIAPHEPCETSGRGGVEPRAQRAGRDHLEDVDRRVEALDRHRPEGLDLDEALRDSKGVGRQQDGTGVGKLLHAGGEVRGLSDGRVIHVEVAADGADDDLSGIQADPDLHLDAMGAANLLAVAADRSLHVERRVAGAHRMVLMGERRPEERHDAVAHHLIHGALVAMDGLHHEREDGIEDLSRLLGVTVGEQLHRPLEVGEEDGHLLALTLQRGLGVDDPFGEVLRRVGLGRGEARLSRFIERRRTLPAEFVPGWVR
jgi:hypothetical protein